MRGSSRRGEEDDEEDNHQVSVFFKCYMLAGGQHGQYLVHYIAQQVISC
jgi:hypothetical protein